MKCGLLLRILLLSAFSCNAAFAEADPQSGLKTRAGVEKNYGKIPLAFVENRGQVDERVQFLIRGPRGTVFFTPREVVFEIIERRPVTPEPVTGEEKGAVSEKPVLPGKKDEILQSVKGVVVRMKFMGASSRVKLGGQDELPGKINILKGKDSSSWKTGIKRYRKINYSGLYRGVNVVYSGEDKELTWKLDISSPRKLKSLRLQYEGIESLSIDNDGNLLMKTAMGTICEKAPEVNVRGRRKQPSVFSSKFVILDGNIAGIEIKNGEESTTGRIKRVPRTLPIIRRGHRRSG